MKRKPVIVTAAISLALAGMAWAFLPTLLFRRQVDYWVHGQGWARPGITWREAKAERANGIRALAPQALPLLIADAKARRGTFSTWIQSARASGPQWMRPQIAPTGAAERCRAEAASALLTLGVAAKPALPDLIQLAGVADLNVQPSALELLGVCGIPSPEVLEVLQIVAANPDPGLRALAALSLWRLQPTNDTAVVIVNQALGAPDSPASPFPVDFSLRWPVEALARLGKDAAPFAPGLRRVLARPGSLESGYLFHLKAPVALTLWKIEGASGAAIDLLAKIQGSLAIAPPQDRDRLEGFLYASVQELAEIPGFCVRAKPLLDEMKAQDNPRLAASRSNALQLVEQTLRRNDVK